MSSESSYVVEYLKALEQRLSEDTNKLETRHLEASIDAQISLCPDEKKAGDDKGGDPVATGRRNVIFDHYVNPDAVLNCLSPFVPSSSTQISSFLEYLRQKKKEKGTDKIVLLDLGSGDGRVCVAAAKLGLVQHAIGLDVSGMCVKAARMLAFVEGVFGPLPAGDHESNKQKMAIADTAPAARCEFHQVDITALPRLLLDNPHLLAERMRSASVVFLYIYPDLMKRIVPLLAKLLEENNNKRIEVVTLVFHVPEVHTVPGHFWDIPETELRVYDRISLRQLNDAESGDMSVIVPAVPDGESIDRDFARNSLKATLPH